MTNYNTFTQNKNNLVKDVVNGKHHDHTRTIFKCAFPDYENLHDYLKPSDEELKRVLFRSDPSTFSPSTVMAESNRIELEEPSVVNELTFEIADISTQLNATNPARSITEHMISYLFNNTGCMVLPKVEGRYVDVNANNGQSTTVTYQVYESEPIYNNTKEFFHVVDQPSLSSKEEDMLPKEIFKFKEFDWAEKKELEEKDILIIETLRRNTVYIDEKDEINNDKELIEAIYDMLKDRVSGKLITLDYLLENRSRVLELAISVLKKLDRKNIGTYSRESDGKLKKRYIPLIMVLDKMILELMLVRKYLDFENGLMTITDVMYKLGLFLVEKTSSIDHYTKLSLREFHDFGYMIGRTDNLLHLRVSDGSIQLPIITNKWLSYNNIIKNTYLKNEWYAVVTTLDHMLADEDSRDIYKKYIGGDPNVLSKLMVPSDYVEKGYGSSKSWIESQKYRNSLLNVPRIIESPFAIIASAIAFLLSVNELFKAYNDIKKGT